MLKTTLLDTWVFIENAVFRAENSQFFLSVSYVNMVFMAVQNFPLLVFIAEFGLLTFLWCKRPDMTEVVEVIKDLEP